MNPLWVKLFPCFKIWKSNELYGNAAVALLQLSSTKKTTQPNAATMTKRILIIDDDKDMLEMLQIVFLASDLEVLISDHGMTGVEIRGLHPDLIMLDVQIKGYIKTGDEICKEIKAHPDLSDIPVFLISSEIDLQTIAFECAADGFINKPIDILKLKTLIRDKLL